MAPKDWKRIDWQRGASVREGEATCKCGAILRGRFAFLQQGREIVSENECVSCGRRLMADANATGRLVSRGPPQPDWAKK